MNLPSFLGFGSGFEENTSGGIFWTETAGTTNTGGIPVRRAEKTTANLYRFLQALHTCSLPEALLASGTENRPQGLMQNQKTNPNAHEGSL